MERGNLSLRCEGRNPRGGPLKDESTDAEHRGGVARSSEEGSVMELERRGCTVRFYERGQPERREELCEQDEAV